MILTVLEFLPFLHLENEGCSSTIQDVETSLRETNSKVSKRRIRILKRDQLCRCTSCTSFFFFAKLQQFRTSRGFHRLREFIYSFFWSSSLSRSFSNFLPVNSYRTARIFCIVHCTLYS